jgi:hypothetical protein
VDNTLRCYQLGFPVCFFDLGLQAQRILCMLLICSIALVLVNDFFCLVSYNSIDQTEFYEGMSLQ